jgi:hypothetical protein
MSKPLKLNRSPFTTQSSRETDLDVATLEKAVLRLERNVSRYSELYLKKPEKSLSKRKL